VSEVVHSMQSVLIVDDDVLFADSLRLLLLDEGIEMVGHASSIEDVYKAVDQQTWDVVLIELHLAGRLTLACGLDVRERCPGSRVIVLTSEAKPDWIRMVSRSGLDGFLTKDVTPLHLLRVIRDVRAGRGKNPFTYTARRRPDRSDGMLTSLLQEQLTQREKQVLSLLVEGLDGCEIARYLQIAPNTVRTHVQNVLVKLQVHSRLEAAAFAVKHGLVDAAAARAS
jgi:two-component system, NarL family, nitrate/nitrite response regulator NarL